MKKLVITLSIVLFGLIGFAQTKSASIGGAGTKATNVAELRLDDETCIFSSGVPIGTKVYLVAERKYYVVIKGIAPNTTFATADAAESFMLLNNTSGISENTDAITANSLRITNNTTDIDVNAAGIVNNENGIMLNTTRTMVNTEEIQSMNVVNTVRFDENENSIAANANAINTIADAITIMDEASEASDASLQTQIDANDDAINANATAINTNTAAINQLQMLQTNTEKFSVAETTTNSFNLYSLPAPRHQVRVSINGATTTAFSIEGKTVTITGKLYQYDEIIITYNTYYTPV